MFIHSYNKGIYIIKKAKKQNEGHTSSTQEIYTQHTDTYNKGNYIIQKAKSKKGQVHKKYTESNPREGEGGDGQP